MLNKPSDSQTALPQIFGVEEELIVLIKLKDVADHVGVSISTVSRVVNNDSSRAINQETRKKIWDAINELGYHQNRIMKKVVKSNKEQSKLEHVVGCIVTGPLNKYNHPYYSFILEGIEKGLAELGCTLAFIHTSEDAANPAILHKIIHESGIDGLILVEGIHDEKTYDYIKKNVTHIVGVDLSDHELPCLGYDRVAASKYAVEHLIEQGHKHIGFIGGPGLAGSMELEKRFRGYKNALAEADLVYNPDWVCDSKWVIEKSYDFMEHLIHNHKEHMPTAMFVASDMMAVSAMKAVSDSGLKVPDDIAFVSLDNIEFAQYSSPPLSTIHIPKFEIGQIAAKLLIDYIQGKYNIPLKVTVPFELIIRESSISSKN